MKTSQQQTDIIAADKEDSFVVPQPTTKPIKNQIPPDIFLKLR